MTTSHRPSGAPGRPGLSRRALVAGAVAGTLVGPQPARAWPAAWDRWTAHAETGGPAVDHGPWQALLDRYLVTEADDGIHRFDYAAVTPAASAQLEGYLDTLAARDPRRLVRTEQFAYWINLYNALTVRLVLAHWPLASIRDIGGLFGRGPWSRPLITIGGQTLTLDDIEHRILRPIWRDPRIHYAVNCASLGCPDLAAEVFTGARIDRQLEAAARAFVGHPRAVRFDADGLRLSSIYDWYAGDFGASKAAVLAHVARYAPPALAGRLAAYAGRIRHGYDWSLNAP